ncbi:MAG TPA: MauE/DoxX family redox-associated membrane protein [Flavobacterium sp.]|jgi:copper chaperone CopZ/uncharacterized membrane protein YphA (DoxX/SURF4 family)
MIHTYSLTGMTCGGCEAKVKSYLAAVPGVTAVEVNRANATVIITMSYHIAVDTLQEALGGKDSKYQITAPAPQEPVYQEPAVEQGSWFATYKPILLIFGYIITVTLLVQLNRPVFDVMQAMQHFMAGFFLVFSFFKLLNLKGFAESYVMYDVIARKIPAWPYAYAFIELGLGLAFLTGFNPLVTNAVTFIVMSISIIGVLQSVLNKRKIQCACLGAVFNLPMSTVTIIEDALMIAMSCVMLWLMW